MKFSWKVASVIAVLALGIIGSLAVAAPKDEGDAKRSDAKRSDIRFGIALPGSRKHLSDLAKELGVSTNQLRDALDSLRDELGPPKLPDREEIPSRAQIERRCNEATDALAKKLNKTGDEVRSAIKAVVKAQIEEAADAGRLSRARADRMSARIDSAGCLPLFGPAVRRFHFDCGPGRGHRGDRFELAPRSGDDELPAGPPIPLGPPAM
jgi:hypothetical protein